MAVTTPTHYDLRLSPTCTLCVSDDTAILAYDGDLAGPARLNRADAMALIAALDTWSHPRTHGCVFTWQQSPMPT